MGGALARDAFGPMKRFAVRGFANGPEYQLTRRDALVCLMIS
jgi:hypothetical protein